MSNKSTQFKPGESGNPNGAPIKGNSWRDAVAEAMAEIPENEKGDKATFKKIICRVLRKKAVNGDLKAIDMLMDREDGKANQTMDINETINSAPAQIIIDGKIVDGKD